MEKLHLRLLLLAFYIFFLGAEPQRAVAQPHLHFNHLNVLNGLSHNKVSSIVQDEEEFIWIGTDHGLNRYDGHEVVIFAYQDEDTTSLHDDHITCLYMGGVDSLWVGTSSGLSRYSSSQGSFTQVKSLPEGKVKAITEDAHGWLWVGYKDQGLYRYDPRSQQVVVIADTQDELHVLSLLVNRQGRLWVGSRQGLLMLDPKKAFSLALAPRYLSEMHINYLLEREDGQLWVATKDYGYTTFNPKTATWQSSTPLAEQYQHVRTLRYTDDSTLWVGSNQGLVEVNTQSGNQREFTAGNEGLSDQSITALYRDREDNLWVGTYHGGVNLLLKNQQVFEHYTLPGAGGADNRAVNAFAIATDGTVWVGSPRGGLNQFDPQQKSLTSIVALLTNEQAHMIQHIKSLQTDTAGKVWIGTHRHGLFVYDPSKETLEKITLPPEVEHPGRPYSIKTLFSDHTGQLFVGLHQGGVGWINQATGATKWLGKEIDYQGVETIYRDAEGRLWIGTVSGLILINDIYRPQQHVTFANHPRDSTSISHNVIRAIFQDRQGQMWIGTEDGLNRYYPEDSTFTTYRGADGLPDKSVKSIVEDEEGYLWLGTAQGLCRFHPDQPSQRFYREDGLQSNQFLPAAALRVGASIYMGGVNGFNVFQPANLSRAVNPSPVILTTFKVNHHPTAIAGTNGRTQSVKAGDQVRLTHRQRMFSVEYRTIDFAYAAEREYFYRLEGFDRRWHKAGSERLATYTDVPPGQYVFKVKSSDHRSEPAGSVTTLGIYILPPWWKTWWANVAYVLLSAGAFYLIMRLHWKWQYEKKEKEKLFQLDMMKVHFIANVSHEIKTPLTLIKTPLDKMVKTGVADPEWLAVMQKNADHLHQLVDQLSDFRSIEVGTFRIEVGYGDMVTLAQDVVDSFRALAQERNINLLLEHSLFSHFGWFDENIVEKVLYNLLSNAFKFTEARGTVRVGLDVQPPEVASSGNQWITSTAWIHLSVQDTGIGIDEHSLPFVFDRFYRGLEGRRRRYEGTGIGLAHVRELVDLHQGVIHIESKPNHGTTVHLFLPTERNAYQPHEIKVVAKDVTPQWIPEVEVRTAADTRKKVIKPRLLIVEDNLDISRIIATEFEEDYVIYRAYDGEEGWNQAHQHVPDFIVSDVLMPKRDGIELCRQLKSHPVTNHIPVVLLTALNNHHHHRKGLEGGADDYISKPFSPDFLRMKVNNIVLTRQRLINKYQEGHYQSISEVATSEADRDFLNKAEQFVRNNLSDSSLSVDDLIKTLGVSRPVAFRKFRALLNETPNEFIKGIRLRKAAELILQQPDSLKEIAYEVGFNDPKYFSKCFKKFYGRLPSQFVQ
ncbi:hybrid sensor histidine kinase/response regulator transcription factor [Tunicatimonas pelagia]|uniref:hybrid sensor histidine kinase/response regulator transcription factor n=1 Tax=Tunicatimonas pelagia TaxID=931531 RepID=UPI00266589B5|nr:two-component regulator propeller domain-containing protein [Tunicatimonas pelagia]WKN44949.1 two-component regulator propeller domain-containing protein [Tunicatimonas pelagia]